MDMKRKNAAIKAALIAVVFAICFLLIFTMHTEILSFCAKAALYSAQSFLPSSAFSIEKENKNEAESEAENETKSDTAAETKKNKPKDLLEEKGEDRAVTAVGNDFTRTPDDIKALIEKAGKNASKDKKDGAISEKQYVNDGVTDKFGSVRLKNLNKTQINIEDLLSKKADLSVNKKEPSVLIFHTHTTESYQYLDRSFYAQGFPSRDKDPKKNMIRIGEAICEQLESAGFKVLHDRVIHDLKYSGAYNNSRATVVEYLKKNPSIQVVLDIHRDAIQLSNGTKIKPVAKINGKKAAQVMIISGCQEEGNPISDFKDWKYNLIFALQLQKEMEETFPGLTRPLFFSPRKYNMNLTHCSLLLEVGSDSNTIEEAEYSGRCIGKSLSQLLEKYVEE